MADNAVPTLAPENKFQEALEQRQRLPTNSFQTDKDAIFDTIAHERIEEDKEAQSSPLKTFFTSLLWFGYAVAILVALALIWSAAKGLFQVVPQ